jgi:hypothetical protein
MCINPQKQLGSIRMSKGSKRRPRSVPADKFGDNWDRIFNKPNKEDSDARKKAGRVRKESP